MKRFFLYLLLFPVIASLVATLWHFVLYGNVSFSIVIGLPRYFLWSVYFNYLPPALAIAAADRLLLPERWYRSATIALVGYASTFLTLTAIYGAHWGALVPALVGAVAATICCLLVDQLNTERLSELSLKIRNAIKILRRWPEAN
jgi:hypothetical protein